MPIHKRILSLVTMGIVVFLTVILFNSQAPALDVNRVEGKEQPLFETKHVLIHSNDVKEEPTLNHENIVSITNKFMDLIHQDINEYQVVNYQTKDELLDDFEEIALREVAQKYVDFYFKEYAGHLYIVPTETPPWFEEFNPYDMIQLKENKVKIVQQNKSEMYGDYSIEITFTYNHQQWRITEIQHL